MANGRRLGIAIAGSLLTGALVTWLAGSVFGWGRWICDDIGGNPECVSEGLQPEHLGLAAVVSGLVLGAWMTILERPRLLLGAQAALPYRTALMTAIGVATGVGLLGGAGTTTFLRSIGWRCESSACPDGVSYGIPFLTGAACFAVVTLAVGVLRLARRLDANLRAAMVVDLVRLACTPVLLLALPALVSFLVGAYLPILGYACLLVIAGMAPLQARWGGRRVFATTTAVFGIAAFAVAYPIPLVSPLLVGYGAVLLLAAGLAYRSPSETRPYGWVDTSPATSTAASNLG